jgi:CheY-like chemotaxis protein
LKKEVSIMAHSPFHLLLVEDDEVEAEAVLRGLQGQGLAQSLTVVANGREALNALRGQAGQPHLPQPCLILSDLNMPQMNGLELLRELRQDPTLKRCIVFLLTHSDREQDKLDAYAYGVAGYLLKTNIGEDFAKLRELLECYRTSVEFPPETIVPS